MFRKKKSIIFLNPDYHCSFIYRDELREKNWIADIYVPNNYPEQLLYDNEDLILAPFDEESSVFSMLKNRMKKIKFFINLCLRYKFHFCYGGIDQFCVGENRLPLNKSFRLYLFIAKIFRCTIVYASSGCMGEETKAHWMKYEKGNVCNNCGWSEKICNDDRNQKDFDIIRRYSDINIGHGFYDSSQFKMTHMKYKSVDLELWNPDIEVPEKFRLEKTNNIRILHSYVDENRKSDNRNIKGSPFVVDAINRLQAEGLHVEYMYIDKVNSRDMRYYQVQADIVVEQLIYGWWGSTGVETMSLGKPVVCFIRKSFKEFFLEKYSEYDSLPIIEADTSTIYDVLKKLVLDESYRANKSKESRLFAKSYFDIKKNAISLEKVLLNN
tara:strand:- start:30354 stop:31499 length:1146 start_codon:yes stop_codon:yes gene_type:complete